MSNVPRRKYSRREMLRLVGLGTLGAIAASCASQPAPTAETIVETVVVEQPVEVVIKETVIVEGEVQEREVVVTATPPPLEGHITMAPGGYMPTESMEWSETNTTPTNMLAILIEEYQELHPGMEIELIQPPPGEGFSREYIVTSMVADTMPDIIYQCTRDLVEEIKKGWWIPFDPSLDLPNLYTPAGEPGSARWIDSFWEVPFEASRIFGAHYTLNFDIVSTMMFYNKDIFEEVGVEAPEWVSELLVVFQKLQDAGYTPYGGVGSWFMYERIGQLGSSLLAPLDDQINPDGGPADYEEVACAIERGIYRHDIPLTREWMRLMKEVAKYRTPDWAEKDANAITDWMQGRIVVVENGTWGVRSTKLNPYVEFEWGMFYPPGVDKAASPLATDTPCYPVGGAPCGWGLTKGARRDNNIGECIDWLMYICAAPNAERLINQRGSTLPNVKGAEPDDPDLRDIMLHLREHEGEAAMFTYYDKTDFESRWDLMDIRDEYITDLIDLDTCVKRQDEVFVEYAERFITENNVDCISLGFPEA